MKSREDDAVLILGRSNFHPRVITSALSTFRHRCYLIVFETQGIKISISSNNELSVHLSTLIKVPKGGMVFLA